MFKKTQRIEKIAFLIGFLLAGAGFLYDEEIGLAILLGAFYSSINFRLMIWSWGRIFELGTQNSEVASMGIITRFALKYAFLILGLLSAIFLLSLHPIGFAIGVGNIFLAILSYLFLPNQTE